jgi:hypothetical protein
VVHGAREHPPELGGANPLFERREQAVRLGDDAVVVFRLAELEEYFGVFDVAPQLLEAGGGLFQIRAATRDDLGLLGVFPEAGGEGGVSQASYFAFEPREVKDAPLAP